MHRYSKNIENIKYLSIATVLFSISWLWLSFTFPLKLALDKMSYQEIGMIGTLTSFPFVIVSFSFRFLGRRALNFAMKAPYIVIALFSTLLIFVNNNVFIYVFIICITGFFQSMWWISVEIETGLIGVEGNAEKYSAAWAIPSGLFPIFSGALLQYVGFNAVYILVIVTSIIGFLIQPMDSVERRITKKGDLKFILLLPMTFVGIFLGYSSYVLVPFLKNSNYSYLQIGALLAISGIAFALGSIYAGTLKNNNYPKFSWISSLLASSFLLLFISTSYVVISLSLFLGGFGGSFGFSKLLSLIGKSESPRNGVFFYETLFSIGYVSGTLLGGTLLSLYGIDVSLLMFIPSLIYSITIYSGYLKGSPSFAYVK